MTEHVDAIWKFPIAASHRRACEQSCVAAANRCYAIGAHDLVLLQDTVATSRGPRVTSALWGCGGPTDNEAASVAQELWGKPFAYLYWFTDVIPTVPMSLEDVPHLEGTYRAMGQQSAQRILAVDAEEVLRATGLDGRFTYTG
ncbi:MAG: hypothetical protein KDA97_12390 [Acidimicrobiales bacterium]|nr:hypothetical protein [Acidimicrobiales bacterium]